MIIITIILEIMLKNISVISTVSEVWVFKFFALIWIQVIF